MAKAQFVIWHGAGTTRDFAEQPSREQTGRFWQDPFAPYFLITLSFWLVCIVESIQKMGGQTLDPRFWMFLSILVTVYGGVNVFHLHSQRRILPPVDSDRTMDKALESIRAKGMVAYEKSGEPGLQVDYVVVGPRGIFVVEAKARNVFGSGTIDYRSDNELILGGKISDNQPLKEARSGAQAIQQLLPQQLSKDHPVTPLVVFSGDWRINQPATDLDVAVMAACDLENFLDRQPATLTKEEIEQVCSYLERPALSTPA
ncbi:MAG: hypothetical protein QOG67_1053 [Verrucomicrobiota bacterium]|jgi:hypothetical protein